MPKFSVNLSMLYTDQPFLERFESAARAGFRAVEYLFPYQEDTDGIARALERLKLEQALFNLPAGDWAAGERGIAADPARREEFRRGVAQAVELARRYRCTRLNCLVGKRMESQPETVQWACLVDNLRYAAQQLDRHGITLLVEPINTYDGSLPPSVPAVVRAQVFGEALPRQLAAEPRALIRAFGSTALGGLLGFGAQ